MASYLGAGVYVPENDQPHREYLEMQASGQLHVQKCSDCGHLRYPVMTACPDCRSLDSEWEGLSGKGAIYSYYMVPHPINPAFREFVPYIVALIELDEVREEYGEGRALRLIGNIVTADGSSEDLNNIAIGKRVQVTMVDLGDGWALPQWQLSDEPPEHEPWQAPGPAFP